MAWTFFQIIAWWSSDYCLQLWEHHTQKRSDQPEEFAQTSNFSWELKRWHHSYSTDANWSQHKDNFLVTYYRVPESFQQAAFKLKIPVGKNALFPPCAIGPHKTQQKLETIAEKSPAAEETFTSLLRHSIFSAFLAPWKWMYTETLWQPTRN